MFPSTCMLALSIFCESLGNNDIMNNHYFLMCYRVGITSSMHFCSFCLRSNRTEKACWGKKSFDTL